LVNRKAAVTNVISLPGRLGPGSRFHNFDIEHLIATGGMGAVYFARHRLVGRPAAVKVISPRPGAVADQKAMARFYTEVEIHVSLRLPNLPDFYDAELLPDGTAVLVLEYLDGRDLADTLKFLGRLPLGDALFITTEILRPLQVVHAKSVHRDIKPSNVFIRRRPRFDSEGKLEKNRVTLLDFGIAQVNLKQGGVTREQTIVGTNGYMSPEQLRSDRLDGRSDLYAVGVVLYEMLCGHPPYVPDPKNVPSLPELLVKTLSEPIPDLRAKLPDLPDDVWEFISVLLAKDRDERYASAEAALAVARTLRKQYRDTTKLFRDEVDDVLEAMESLKAEGWAETAPRRPVTNPMATDPSMSHAFATTEETRTASANDESPSSVEVAPPTTPTPDPIKRTPLMGTPALIEALSGFPRAADDPQPSSSAVKPDGNSNGPPSGGAVPRLPNRGTIPINVPPAPPPAATADQTLRSRPTMLGLQSPGAPLASPKTTAPEREEATSLVRSAPPAVAPRSRASPASSGPIDRATARIRSGDSSAPIDEWEERQLRRVRELLRAPRYFRRPALIEMDPTSKRPSAMYELGHTETIVGSGSKVGIQVRGQGVAARHAVLHLRRDRQLEVELSEEGLSGPRGLTVDGRPCAQAMLVHGARVGFGDAEFKLIDLTVGDPSGERVRIRKRTQPPTIAPMGRASSSDLDQPAFPLTLPLVLGGSSPACDFVIEGAPSVAFGIWTRGDGELELVEIDVSVLPYGQPITGCRLLKHGDTVQVGSNLGVILSDPPECSRVETKGPPEVSPVPQPVVPSVSRRPELLPDQAPVMLPVTPAKMPRDKLRLVLVAMANDGFTAPTPAMIDLDGTPLVLGRDPKVDVVVRHPRVRSSHLFLKPLPDASVEVEDLGAGRLEVRGERVQKTVLRDGDQLTIPGVVSFELRAPAKPGIFSRFLRKLGLAVFLLGVPCSGDGGVAPKKLSNPASCSASGSTS
jgi:serine/threonine protein kinase/pSer/pThr/pTyr-binding forkhead associated (FHA) protein